MTGSSRPWTSPSGRSTWPERCAPRTASRRGSRWRAPGWRSRIGASPSTRSCSTSSPRRSTSRSSSASRTARSSSSGASSRCCPKIGKRLGSAIPAVMAAAREGAVEFGDDGSVTLGGVTLAPDEVEIQATPRPGTAVAEDDGLVMVLDTALTPELRAEGDARELARAIQDLRREAGLELDDRIELWVVGAPTAGRGAPAGRRRRHAGASSSADDVPADAARTTRPARRRDRDRSRCGGSDDGRRPGATGPLAVVPRPGRDRRRRRSADQGAARLDAAGRGAAPVGRRRSRPARQLAQQRGAVRPLPGPGAAVRAGVGRGRGADHLVSRAARGGTRSCRWRWACCSGARSATCSIACGSATSSTSSTSASATCASTRSTPRTRRSAAPSCCCSSARSCPRASSRTERDAKRRRTTEPVEPVDA